MPWFLGLLPSATVVIIEVRLTRTGTQKVLVIRVVSNTHFPTQSEAKMYDDVFIDDNNLVSGLVASMIVLASITTCYIDY